MDVVRGSARSPIYIIEVEHSSEDQDARTPLAAALADLRPFNWRVTSRAQFFSKLEGIAVRLRTVRPPCVFLHITAHGTSQGVAVGCDEIPWGELYEPLAEINRLAGGHLILSVCSCHGGFAFQMAYCQPPPFHFLIGPDKEIGKITAAKWFNIFHVGFARGLKIQQAVKLANQETGEDMVAIASDQIQDWLRLRAI